MEPKPSLIQLAQTQQEALPQQPRAAAQAPHQFNSVEDLLRCDAGQTPAPPSLESRVKESIAREGPAAAPWWKRWLGRD